MTKFCKGLGLPPCDFCNENLYNCKEECELVGIMNDFDLAILSNDMKNELKKELTNFWQFEDSYYKKRIAQINKLIETIYPEYLEYFKKWQLLI